MKAWLFFYQLVKEELRIKEGSWAGLWCLTPLSTIFQLYCGKLTMLVVIGIDCIGSYKSNYHMITATTTPIKESVAKTWTTTKMEEEA